MIVADPRRIPLADMANLYLPLRVGSDVALLLGMAHVIARDGLIDEEFIGNRTTNSEALFEHLQGFPPDWAADITGLESASIEQAAQLYAEAERGAI